MIVVLVFLCAQFFQEQVPYKPSDEFNLKLDYDFKHAVADNTRAYDISRTPSQQLTGPQPYLTLSLKFLTLQPGELKVRVQDNHGNLLMNKKAVVDEVYKIDAGFTADIKDRVKPNEFEITLTGKDKHTVISHIVIHIGEDGSFLVNNEKRGQM